MQHVPYKSSAQALTDVIARQIEMTYVSTVFIPPFIRDGRVRALGLTAPERVSALPDLPTFREQGYPDMVVTGMYGLWFPAKTPPARVNRIQSEVRKMIASPEMKAKLDEFGLFAIGSTPAEFAKFIQQDIEFQRGIVKRAGIALQ